VRYAVRADEGPAGNPARRFTIAEAEIDCATHRRRSLGTETQLRSGAIERDGRAGPWRPIPDALERTERLVCRR
jgi:hypothetical protein